MNKSVIQVKNASFGYGIKPVFSNLSFAVEKGCVYCIVGPNGCGKTTLLDCILGLLKVNAGDILIDKINNREIKPRQLAEMVAYIPQLHQRAFPYLVKEVVLMGRAHKTSLFSSPTQEDQDIAKQAMEKVGILHLSDQPYTQISGGQCQLVMIARALAQQPEVIVMDEPTSHLDFKNELILLETILDLVRNQNISIVMATHFPNHAFFFEANNIPTTLALMNHGTFEQVGKPTEVLSEENVRSIYGIQTKLLIHEGEGQMPIRQIVPLTIIKELQHVMSGGDLDGKPSSE